MNVFRTTEENRRSFITTDSVFYMDIWAFLRLEFMEGLSDFELNHRIPYLDGNWFHK